VKGCVVNGLSLEKHEGLEDRLEDQLVKPDPWEQALRLWHGLLRISRRAPRRLRLCESLPLGDRRFVAVVEFDQARFLVGGTSASLVLLARLESAMQEAPAPIVNEPGNFEKGRP